MSIFLLPQIGNGMKPTYKMVQINNFTNNDDVRFVDTEDAFQVAEYKRDLSVTLSTAMTAYFSNETNVRKRQLVCDINGQSARKLRDVRRVRKLFRC